MTFHLEEITSVRESKMEELWKEFQSVLHKYVKTTEAYHNGYNDLRKRDNTDTKTIKIHYINVANATELINELKSNLDTIKEDHSLNMKNLQNYKRKLQEKYNELKSELEMGQNMDKNQLKDLAVKSCSIIKKLQKNDKEGEILLQKAAICRKMETEMEKILPFGTKNKLFMLNEDEIKSPPEEIKLITNEFLTNEMENFWLRYNRAKVDCACLAEEKVSLKTENQQLKEQLRNYLTSVTLKNAGKRDERFLNRPHSMKIEKIVQIDISKVLLERYGKRRPVTCIEGNLSVAVRSQRLITNKIKTPSIFN